MAKEATTSLRSGAWRQGVRVDGGRAQRAAGETSTVIPEVRGTAPGSGVALLSQSRENNAATCLSSVLKLLNHHS